MLTITPEMELVLERAADLRASGFSWTQTAEKLGFVGDDLKDIARQAGNVYERMLARARRHLVYESLSESILKLRQYMRSHDDREMRHSADTLSRIGMCWYRHRSRCKVKVIPDKRSADLSDEA